MHCQIDFVLLVTTFWAQRLSQFSVHLIQPILYQLLYEDLIGDSVKSLNEV